MTFASYLAIAGTILNLIRFIPQVIKSHREGFCGLSLTSWMIGFVEISIWATWAIVSQQYIAGVSSFVMCPVALWFVIRIIQCRTSSQSHRVFETLPHQLVVSEEITFQPTAA